MSYKAETELDIGDIFDAGNNNIFEIEKKLGKGGFGITYLVRHKSSSERLVAKIPLILKDENDDYRIKKQIQEASILQKLNDKNVPNVVRLRYNVSASTINGYQVPIMIMEIARGKTCAEIINDNPTSFSSEVLVRIILIKIATALDQVHQLGIIHRDVKPDNIFIDKVGNDPEITLIDFGIAAAFNQSSSLNQATCVGTPFYSPPEQCDRGKGIVSPSADVYALAATGFHLITGRTLAGMSGKYDPRGYVQPGTPVSEEFANILIKATWPEMQHRFPSMSDFLAALKGEPPADKQNRIICDGKSYPINKDYVLIGRANSNLVPPPDIEVIEYSQPGINFLSRKHCYIQKGQDGYYRLFDHQSTNGTVWLNSSKEWKPVPTSGLILANLPVVIGLGFSDVPTGKIDINGNEIMPGAYRIIEYRPAEKPTTTGH